ncbi:hypothetical protein [Mycolicibacterium phlei]|uniref:hypothetical protein n=1 Tax=Mycolicibacterium phlei TaxID=1771 RepID=UPI000777B0CA|nr:hypothetical protein [Mycolicibacterium phlei]
MPSFRRRASVIDAGNGGDPQNPQEESVDPDEALRLAEEAEAEAAAAEARAAAARARAEAIRLRKQAEEAATAEVKAPEVKAPEVDTAEADDADEPVETTEAAETTEAGDVVETTEKAAQTTEPVRRRRGWLKVAAAVLAIVLTLGFVGVSGYMVWEHRQAEKQRQLSAEYAAAARQSVVTLMSLDFNKAQEDVQRIIDNSAGQFREDFEAQAEDFVKVAKESKVVTEVNVNATAVKSMTETTATALVSATSRVTNAAGAKQEPRSWRLAIDLVREGDQIKMSKVEFVP